MDPLGHGDDASEFVYSAKTRRKNVTQLFNSVFFPLILLFLLKTLKASKACLQG